MISVDSAVDFTMPLFSHSILAGEIVAIILMLLDNYLPRLITKQFIDSHIFTLFELCNCCWKMKMSDLETDLNLVRTPKSKTLLFKCFL